MWQTDIAIKGNGLSIKHRSCDLKNVVIANPNDVAIKQIVVVIK